MVSTPFDGKAVLITGGTSGIGRATALAFAQEGARVTIAGRREDKGEEVSVAIDEAGGEGLFVQTDVAVEDDVAAMVTETVEAFGGLDVVFNNAGVFLESGPITEVDQNIIDQTLSVNVRGVALCLKHEIPALLTSGGGAIVNTASFLGIRSFEGSAIYNASKAGIIALTKTAALEFATEGVRVNAICPGIIETEMNEEHRKDAEGREALAGMEPVGRLGRPEEVAAAVRALCLPDASFTTGAVLSVDGGITV